LSELGSRRQADTFYEALDLDVGGHDIPPVLVNRPGFVGACFM